VSDDGKVEMVTFTSRQLDESHDYPKWVFPMETGESTDQTPLQTANAGVQTEIAQVEGGLVVEFGNDQQPIFSFPVRGDNGGTHTKHVFIGRVVSGRMRSDKPRQDKNPRNGRIEELGLPEYKEAEVLLGLMRQRGKRFHRIALIEALSFLAKDPKVVKRYWELLEAEASQAVQAVG
jgi:hypothetical protein